MSFDEGDYPENLQIVSVIINKHSFESFVCLDPESKAMANGDSKGKKLLKTFVIADKRKGVNQKARHMSTEM